MLNGTKEALCIWAMMLRAYACVMMDELVFAVVCVDVAFVVPAFGVAA